MTFYVARLLSEILLFYYVLSNASYFVFFVIALLTSVRHQRKLASIRLEHIRTSPFTPPVTVLMPARNEEACITESVRSLLALDYPALEIIVINDDSTDSSLSRLASAYRLRPVHLLYVADIPCAPVRQLYASEVDERLLVLDKVSGRSKADAINAGVNAASSPWVCVVDADSVLERDALLRVMAAVYSDPRQVVGVGGIVRVMNGCAFDGGSLLETRLPSAPLEVLQVVEYLRAFLIGRAAWEGSEMLPIISGAFGVFRADVLKKVGGFRANAVGEDMDLVLRLHRYFRKSGTPYHLAFVTDPTCWTQAPTDLVSLGRQRTRWQKGLMECLWRTRDMLLRPRFGRVGMVLLPYLWIFELLAPLFEIAGYAGLVVAALSGAVGMVFLAQFLVFGYLMAVMISISGILLEELTYRRYGRWQDVTRLIMYCFFEHFPYRQLTMLWGLQGIWQYLRGDLRWQELRRQSFAAPSAAAGAQEVPPDLNSPMGGARPPESGVANTPV